MGKPEIKVRTRFAPSPTGMLHVGGFRTALMSYLHAKKNGGEFILRIEDTDRARFVEGAEENIVASLESMGIKPDQGPIRQSDRLDIYKKYADTLKAKGLLYDSDGALRFKIPKGRTVKFDDVIRGTIETSTDVLEDFVCIKSDGFPTYHFANVVDDHLMEITDVIRADEWISSTPKHVLLYEAFGFDLPNFAHVPQVLGPDKSKLSKRHGAKGVFDYLNEGYLPQALTNFLAMLGWHPKDEREIFTLKELIAEFELADVQKSPAVFDADKLIWMNGQHLKSLSENEHLAWVKKAAPEYAEDPTLPKIASLLKERANTFADFKALSAFFFMAPKPQKLPRDILVGAEEALANGLEGIEDRLRALAATLGLKPGEVFMAVRLALTGSKVSPPLVPSMEILGVEEVKKRIEEALRVSAEK